MDQDIVDRIETVRNRMAAAVSRSGRELQDVTLVAVSKTRTVEEIRAAYRAGMRHFGENRVAEAADKFGELADPAVIHGIGHIQRNKAALAASVFDWIQSIDKESTLAALARHRRDTPIKVLLEVNTSGESTKHGVRGDDELRALRDAVLSEPGFELRGLMTMAPFSDDGASPEVRRCFSDLRELFLTLAPDAPKSFDTISMGMSNDFETAIEEGATMVRIGTAIFGRRGER